MPTIQFQCPECQLWTTSHRVSASEWDCMGCSTGVRANAASDGPLIETCRLCGNAELYVQKAFPHWLGMTILVIAIAASFVTYQYYWIWLTWGLLIGSATIDMALYFLMGNMTVCYRCRTQYRGFEIKPEHEAFELTIGEKYRQEKIRREQLREK